MAKQLTQPQRYYICLRIASFDSVKNIAIALKVDKSTVYREIKRNKSNTNDYNGSIAHKKATARRRLASNGKVFRLFTKKVLQYLLINRYIQQLIFLL